MSGRLSPIEEVNLVAKIADLKLELLRQSRTLDALIALLEDKGLLHADELQEKAWQLDQRFAALRRQASATGAAATEAAKPAVIPKDHSVPAFLRHHPRLPRN